MSSITIEGTPYFTALEEVPSLPDYEYTSFIREYLVSNGMLPEGQLRTLKIRVCGHLSLLLGIENTVQNFIDLREVDFSGLELRGLDLSYSYLAGADFRWSRIFDVAFQMSVLTGAILDGAVFDWVQASPMIITGSSWRQARILNSFFDKQDLDVIREIEGVLVENCR